MYSAKLSFPFQTEKNTVVKQKFDYLPTYNPHGYLRLWPNGIIPYEYDKELSRFSVQHFCHTSIYEKLSNT